MKLATGTWWVARARSQSETCTDCSSEATSDPMRGLCAYRLVKISTRSATARKRISSHQSMSVASVWAPAPRPCLSTVATLAILQAGYPEHLLIFGAKKGGTPRVPGVTDALICDNLRRSSGRKRCVVLVIISAKERTQTLLCLVGIFLRKDSKYSK